MLRQSVSLAYIEAHSSLPQPAQQRQGVAAPPNLHLVQATRVTCFQCRFQKAESSFPFPFGLSLEWV